MKHADRIPLALQESARLEDYINALPAERLGCPTACALWNVRDLIAHLILSARYQMTMIARGLAGNCSPPEGFPPAGSVNAATFSPIIHHNTLRIRDALADDALTEYNVVSDRFDDVLRKLVPADLTTPCYDLRGIAMVGDFVDLRLMELVIHGWDLRSRLEREAHLPQESFPVLADVIVRAFPWLFWPSATAANPICYRFEVDGMQPARWDIVVERDRAHLARDIHGAADATITCQGETFVLFMFGRLTAADALASGRMVTSADHALIAHLDQWFKGF
jgi:uncharacterized protein (TIGR03083 family)